MLPESVRKDFPILERRINGNRLIFFDSAASSLKPVQVVERMSDFYLYHYSNIHRGIYELSEEATELYEKSRERIASFINGSSREIIFVRNTTEAINLVSFYLHGKEGDEKNIVISGMEHHSNIVPWILLRKRTGKYTMRIIPVTDEGLLDLSSLDKVIDDDTVLVSVTHVSNVLGTINPVKYICRVAHEHNALCMVDGAQSTPHLPIDVKDIGTDFFAFSSHKMLGPTGLGVLYVREKILEEMEPVYGGGGMISEVHCSNDGCVAEWAELPDRFEAGTPHIAGVIGLAAAIEYLERIGLGNIEMHERKLTEKMLNELQELEEVRIAGPLDVEKKSGIVSFEANKYTPHELSSLLSMNGVAVRSGFHCAQPIHERLKFTRGTTRASFYLYNTLEEIDDFIGILKKIL